MARLPDPKFDKFEVNEDKYDGIESDRDIFHTKMADLFRELGLKVEKEEPENEQSSYKIS